MKARVKLIEDIAFMGETGSGHSLVIDGPPALGGRNLGPRPMELLLLGMASCSSLDVVHILRKGRQNVEDVDAEVTGERAETDPKVFTKMHIHFKVKGEGLTESKVERAVQLSAEKYCSASIMLGKAAEITHSYELLP